MNILFFGASVTEQLEGYFKFIKENILFHSHSIDRYSFGGCHLDDAGFFNVGKLRGLNPDIVIFEWNTTARKIYDQDRVNYIFDQVVEMRALPVILILPHEGNINVDRESERQMIKLANDYGYPLIDIRKEIISRYALNELLRDGVHTNLLGGEIFGSTIAINMLSILSEPRCLRDITKMNSDHFKIDEFVFGKSGMEIKKQITFVVHLKSKKWGLCLYHEIGPFSPVAKISINKQFNKKLSFWDPYCHYSRMHYTSLLSSAELDSISEGSFELKISISSELPDYSICRRGDVIFDMDRKIKAHIFYCYGLELEVEEWK